MDQMYRYGSGFIVTMAIQKIVFEQDTSAMAGCIFPFFLFFSSLLLMYINQTRRGCPMGQPMLAPLSYLEICCYLVVKPLPPPPNYQKSIRRHVRVQSSIP